VRTNNNELGLGAAELIDINELSERWRIPKAALYNWVSQGRLPYVKLGRCIRFDPTELQTFVNQGKMISAGKR
jgi:excisionase family DNA binding protein